MPLRALKLNCCLTAAKFISLSMASIGADCVGRCCESDVMGIIDTSLILEAFTWIVLNRF